MEKLAYALKTKSQYPINNINQIKTAALYWEQNHNKFCISDLIEYAQNVSEQADKLGITQVLPESMKKVAQLDINSYSKNLEDCLTVRGQFSKYGVSPYKKLLEKKAEVSPYVFAQALEQLDIKTGANKAWGNMLSRPHEIVFEIKKTADYKAVLNHPKLKEILGEEGVEALQTMGDVFWNTIPTPVKEEILNLQ